MGGVASIPLHKNQLTPDVDMPHGTPYWDSLRQSLMHEMENNLRHVVFSFPHI